jgi:hypothetical protein
VAEVDGYEDEGVEEGEGKGTRRGHSTRGSISLRG